MERFPTPELLAKASRSKLQKWMHAHKLWFAQKNQERLEILLAPALKASAATVRAKSLLAVSLSKMPCRQEPTHLPLGPSLLHGPPEKGQNPRLRLALSRPALAQNPLENVADTPPL